MQVNLSGLRAVEPGKESVEPEREVSEAGQAVTNRAACSVSFGPRDRGNAAHRHGLADRQRHVPCLGQLQGEQGGGQICR